MTARNDGGPAFTAPEDVEGESQDSGDHCTRCSQCGGNGWKAVRNPHHILPGIFEVRCDDCNGFGWVQEEDPIRP